MSSNRNPPESMKNVCKNCTVSWIDIYLTPRKTVSFVEGYVILAAVFLLILLVLGPLRRRSRHWLVQYGVRAAHMLSFPLLSYILGLMQGIVKNELYPVWATFLVLLFGGASSVSVQKLDENKQWLKLMFDNCLYLYYVGTISGNFAFSPGTAIYIRFGALVILFVLISTRNIERISALAFASDPRRSGSRTVDRHMKNMHEDELAGEDPARNYKYLVLPFVLHTQRSPEGRTAVHPAGCTERRSPDNLITLDKIWSDGNFLSDDPAIRHLKDVCLSFALFRLAVRRYFGYSCAESELPKARDLVLKELLPRGEEDSERAFQVIEVELAFLYDFFFTKHAKTMHRGEVRSAALSLAITVLTVGIGTYALFHPSNNAESFWDLGLVETTTQDIIVTKVILCAIAIFQLLQTWMYCSSDWAKVSLVCKCVSKSSWKGNIYIMKKLLLYMGEFSLFLEKRKWFQRWENKIGQYSLMDSFSHPSHGLGKFIFSRIMGGKTPHLCGLEKFIPWFRKGRKLGTPIVLPVEVKKAIARTLKDSDGQISSGALALKLKGMLNCECDPDDKFTPASAILVLHIATSYCEDAEVNRTGTMEAQATDEANRLVATSLSKYCAYLVAFAPEFVPGNPLETESTLDELLEDLDRLIQVSQTEGQDIYRKLEQLETQKGMLAEGAMLGMEVMELVTMEGQVSWKLLADLWAELMLYIAPSENAAGHIESLAQGGEFVTHVWALLMHAGILVRPPASICRVTMKQNCPNQCNV